MFPLEAYRRPTHDMAKSKDASGELSRLSRRDHPRDLMVTLHRYVSATLIVLFFQPHTPTFVPDDDAPCFHG